MPSTIGWGAVAVATGALAGLALGHWAVVSAWLGRCLRDPTLPPPSAGRDHPAGPRARRTP